MAFSFTQPPCENSYACKADCPDQLLRNFLLHLFKCTHIPEVVGLTRTVHKKVNGTIFSKILKYLFYPQDKFSSLLGIISFMFLKVGLLGISFL